MGVCVLCAFFAVMYLLKGFVMTASAVSAESSQVCGGMAGHPKEAEARQAGGRDPFARWAHCIIT